MNICVCVKQVEHTYARTGMDPRRHYLNPQDRIFRVNPYDEAAMELALKAKSRIARSRVIVLTLGAMQAEEELWRLVGLGADQLCHVELTRPEAPDAPFDSWTKAALLGQAVRAVAGDIVLCGKESIDRRNGLVGACLARQLDRPFVSGIMDLDPQADGAAARVTQNAGKGRRRIVECGLPAVFSVDLFSGTPAIAAFASVRDARRQPLTRLVYNPDAITPKTRCLGIEAPRPRTRPVVAPDSGLPAYDRIQTLLAGSKIQKKGKTVLGPPDSQVREIMDFLEFHGFLRAPEKPAP